jgi:hypothetical protein
MRKRKGDDGEEIKKEIGKKGTERQKGNQREKKITKENEKEKKKRRD